MPLHDRIVTTACCYNGHSAPVEVQFGYGPTNYRDVNIGDAIDWSYDGRRTYGSPGARKVRVLAWVGSTVRSEAGTPSIGCPICGCEYPAHIVEIEFDRITRIRPVAPGEQDELQDTEWEFAVDE